MKFQLAPARVPSFLALCGLVVSLSLGQSAIASAQLSPGLINVSANIYGLSGPISPSTASSSDGSAVTANQAFFDPVASDNSGTATATAAGGSDTSIMLTTTGIHGSSTSATPFDYNVSGTITYSYEDVSAVSDAPAVITFVGGIAATGGLFYPAMFDLTSSAAPVSNEDLLNLTLDPSMDGNTADYNLFVATPQDFGFNLPILTDTVYTVSLSASYFSDLGPDNVTVDFDPTITLTPAYASSGTLIFSQGFGPASGPTVPDSSLPVAIVAAAMGAMAVGSRFRRYGRS